MVNDVLPSTLDGRLPHYAPSFAVLSRALCDARAVHPGVPSGLRPQGISRATFERAITLELECAHGPMTVLVDADDYPALQTIALDTEPQRATALANMWLADTLASFGTDDAGTLAVKAIEIDNDPRDLHGLALSYTAIRVERTCLLTRLPIALASDYARAWTATPRIVANTALDDILMPGVVRLRSRRYSPSMLASLRRNDVLIGWLPGTRYSEREPLDQASLRFGAARGIQFSAAVRVDAHAVTLETPLTSMNDAQSDESSLYSGGPDMNASEMVDVSAMDLPVHIELLTVNLSVAQIGALKPGYVLDLPLPLTDAPVRLVAYGQTLGFGRLVAVGTNLGVQINRMAAGDER
ncbi:type III secretion system cytoplasmic ring protein SctQ [Burkholderia lata]|uniref:type III secretion system cytoplasmic ring protein SctQ n=1 Tax=Burkholderia lata (strain ATCC 17760 / DSM 23089 / LMG 22485 / NCIMB 9086 / R18194 / 383) TaxID=482957 RepID=UPI0014535C39|nr:type III secretion system cytoplasmic ring protein SctQ [Burkholderia lata]VWB88563.1 type III secretion protein [Burkholderia lata]